MATPKNKELTARRTQICPSKPNPQQHRNKLRTPRAILVTPTPTTNPQKQQKILNAYYSHTTLIPLNPKTTNKTRRKNKLLYDTLITFQDQKYTEENYC